MNTTEDLLEYGLVYRTLRYLNRIIYILILLICATIITSPYLGEISYAFNKASNKYASINDTKNNTGAIAVRINSNLDDENINTIIIPSIDLKAPIKELASIEDLRDGAWRRPLTSTPEKGGNTVIIAHRYTRRGEMSGPNTFYHLPKVKIGEKVFVLYEGTRYTYEVYNVEVVSDDSVEIEDATTTANILTLYTCTPLWSAKDRHVVQARLVSESIN